MSQKYQSLYVSFPGKSQGRQSSTSNIFSHFICLLIILLLVSGALGKVYLDKETATMRVEWEATHERINVLKKEAENLRLAQEEYMNGDYILREAKKLDLRASEPGQVRVMRKGAKKHNDSSLEVTSR